MGSAWDIAAIRLLDAAAKSVLIFAAAMLLSVALRRRSAASRHSLWVAAMAGMFCLPLMRLTLPAWRLHVLPPATMSVRFQPGASIKARPEVKSAVAPGLNAVPLTARNLVTHATAAGAAVAAHGDAVAPSSTAYAMSPRATRAASGRVLRTVSGAFVMLWMAGAVCLFLRLGAGLIGAWRLVRSCEPMPPTAIMEAGARLLSVSSRVQVRIGATASQPRVPMTCWGRAPIILLPSSASEWPQERLRSVVLHEMAHVKRRDWFTMLLAQTVCAIYWMNPLAWIAGRLLRLEAEKASDDLVLLSGVSPVDYATHLVAVARSLVSRDRPVAAMAMARQSDIAQRLSAILAFRAAQASRGGGRVLAIVVLVVAGLLASVQLSPRGQAIRAVVLGAASGVLRAQLINTFVTDPGMNTVAFTPDSARMLTGSWDDRPPAPGHGMTSPAHLAFRSVLTGKQILGRQLSTALVAAAYSPNGRILATLYAGGYLHLSDGETGWTLRAVHLPSAALDTVEFSPDGLTVACAAVGDGKSPQTSGRLFLVDTATAKLRGPEYRGIFRHLQQRWDGRPFTVASQQWRVVQWGPDVTLWSPHWGQPTVRLDIVADACASHGTLLAVLSGGDVQVWDTAARRPLTSFSTGVKSDRAHSRLAFSPDGRYIALGARGVIKVWRIAPIESAGSAFS